MYKIKKYQYEGNLKALEILGFTKIKHLWWERYTNGSIEVFTGKLVNINLTLNENTTCYSNLKNSVPIFAKNMINFVEGKNLSLIHKYNLILPLYNQGLISLVEVSTYKEYNDDWDYNIAKLFMKGYSSPYDKLLERHKRLQKLSLEYLDLVRKNVINNTYTKSVEFNLEKWAKDENYENY